MSIWVRLIGGLNDGEVLKVDNDQVDINRGKAFPPPATRAFNGAYGIEPSVKEMKVTHYTRRTVNTPDGTVTYFAHDALSDLQALQHALGP